MELWPAAGAEPRGCVALWLPSHKPHGGQLRWRRASCLHWGLHIDRAGLDDAIGDEIGDVRLCRRLPSSLRTGSSICCWLGKSLLLVLVLLLLRLLLLMGQRWLRLLVLQGLLPGLVLRPGLQTIKLLYRRISGGFEIGPWRHGHERLRGWPRQMLWDPLRRRKLRPWNAGRHRGLGHNLSVPNAVAHCALLSGSSAPGAKLLALVHIVTARTYPVPEVTPLHRRPRGIPLCRRWRSFFDRLELSFQFSNPPRVFGRFAFGHRKKLFMLMLMAPNSVGTNADLLKHPPRLPCGGARSDGRS